MACRYIFTQPDGSTVEFRTEAEAAGHIRQNLLGRIQPKRDRADFTTDTMAAVLRQSVLGENNFDPATMRAFQTTILDEFIRMEKQAEYFSKIGPIVALTKGFSKDFAHIDRLRENLRALGIDDEFGDDIPFDVRYVLTGEERYRIEAGLPQGAWFHKISANNIKKMKEVDALSRTMFMERTLPFMHTLTKVAANLKATLPSDKIEEMKNELSAFYQVAAYKQWLRHNKLSTTTLRNNLIYDDPNSTEPTIVDIVKEAVELAPNNAFLQMILPVSTIVRVGARNIRNVIARDLINTIEGRTRGKLEPDMIANMMDSFLELYTNPNTKMHAKALFDYLIVKDAGMFKNRSFIKMVPTLMFKEMSDATGMATRLMAANTVGELRQVFGELHRLRVTDPGTGKVEGLFNEQDIANARGWFTAATPDTNAIRNLLYNKVFGRSEFDLYEDFEKIYATDVRFQFNLRLVKPYNVTNKLTRKNKQASGFKKVTEVYDYIHVTMFPDELGKYPRLINGEKNPEWNRQFGAFLEELTDAGFTTVKDVTQGTDDERQERTNLEFPKFLRLRTLKGEYELYMLRSVRRYVNGQRQHYEGAAMVKPGQLVPSGVDASYMRVAVVGASNTTGVAALGQRPTLEEMRENIKRKSRRDEGGELPGAAPLPVSPSPTPTPGMGGGVLGAPDAGTSLTHTPDDPMTDHPMTDTSNPSGVTKAQVQAALGRPSIEQNFYDGKPYKGDDGKWYTHRTRIPGMTSLEMVKKGIRTETTRGSSQARYNIGDLVVMEDKGDSATSGQRVLVRIASTPYKANKADFMKYEGWTEDTWNNQINKLTKEGWESYLFEYLGDIDANGNFIPKEGGVGPVVATVAPKFAEHTSDKYSGRTVENAASADATIAIATDFTTAGEKLTKNAVTNNKKKYIPIDFSKSQAVTKERVDKLVEMLNEVNAKTLNIAGNGIYSMKGKHTQAQVDEFTYQLLKAVVTHPNLKNKIISIRSGGQTGFDEAGIKAAMRLGIPSTVLAPKGWLFRNADGKDVTNEKEFKQRFGVAPAPQQGDLFTKPAQPAQPAPQQTTSPTDIDQTQSASGFTFGGFEAGEFNPDDTIIPNYNDEDISNAPEDC